jgi:intein/homing endonuclease
MIGKRPLKHENQGSSSSSIKGGFLSISEVSDYFNYLKKAEGFFRDVFEGNPEELKNFSKDEKFHDLTQVLKDLGFKGKRFERRRVESNKELIEEMKGKIKEMLEQPSKKICVNEIGPGGDWHEAFEVMLRSVHLKDRERKVEFKESLFSLLGSS